MAQEYTLHYNIPKPNVEFRLNEEIMRLGDIWTLLDGILFDLRTDVNGKAAANHTHPQSEITGLVDALEGKMDADAIMTLNDLADVSVAGAPVNYVLVKRLDGTWGPSSAIAALGAHQHKISDVGTLSAALGGFRNKIINGGFDIWQRGASQTASGYGSDDRWTNNNTGSSKSHTLQTFSLGQTEVPGEPTYYSRTSVTSVAGAGNFVSKAQRIEGVRTLAGKQATISFWARSSTALKPIAIELVQSFGTGGSASSFAGGVSVTKVTLGTTWTKYKFLVSVPSIAGKTIGTDGNDYLGLVFWFDAGANWNARTLSLGQQSGTFDIARVSLVEGDATEEDDPCAGRTAAQELVLCQRFYCRAPAITRGYSPGANTVLETAVNWRAVMHHIPTTGVIAGGAVNNCTVQVADASILGARHVLTSTGSGDTYANQVAYADAEI